jgi:hypothetical protein
MIDHNIPGDRDAGPPNMPELEHLEHLGELLELYRRARRGELEGEPGYTPIGGRRMRLAAAA